MKVMLSLSEATVAALDDLAAEAGSTRSALVAALAENEVRERRKRRAATLKAWLDGATEQGGNVAEIVREDRHR
jgi:predicted transcriptional regulator